MVGPKVKKMVFIEGIVECFWSFRRTIGRDTTPWGGGDPRLKGQVGFAWPTCYGATLGYYALCYQTSDQLIWKSRFVLTMCA